MKVGEYLSQGFTGCSDNNCLFRPKKGVGTNGGCRCIVSFSRAELYMLHSRLMRIKDVEIEEQT